MTRNSHFHLTNCKFRVNVFQVLPDMVGESTFCFTPKELGHAKLQVNLTAIRADGTVFPGDGVERELLIEVTVFFFLFESNEKEILTYL